MEEKKDQQIFGLTSQGLPNVQEIYTKCVENALIEACKVLSSYQVCPDGSGMRHTIKCDVLCTCTPDKFDSADCWKHYLMEDCK